MRRKKERPTSATDALIDYNSSVAVGAEATQVFWAADGVMDIKLLILEGLIPVEAEDIQDMWIEPCLTWKMMDG